MTRQRRLVFRLYGSALVGIAMLAYGLVYRSWFGLFGLLHLVVVVPMRISAIKSESYRRDSASQYCAQHGAKVVAIELGLSLLGLMASVTIALFYSVVAIAFDSRVAWAPVVLMTIVALCEGALFMPHLVREYRILSDIGKQESRDSLE